MLFRIGGLFKVSNNSDNKLRERPPFSLGNKFRVDSIKEPYSYLAQKLSSMGLVSGLTIEITNVAPLGDPVQIRALGYHLSLRLDEMGLLNLTQL